MCDWAYNGGRYARQHCQPRGLPNDLPPDGPEAAAWFEGYDAECKRMGDSGCQVCGTEDVQFVEGVGAVCQMHLDGKSLDERAEEVARTYGHCTHCGFTVTTTGCPCTRSASGRLCPYCTANRIFDTAICCNDCALDADQDPSSEEQAP